MENDTLSILFPLLWISFAIAPVGIVLLFVKHIHQNTLLPLKRFHSKTPLPAGAITLPQLRIARGIQLNNVVKILENSQTLFLKLPLNAPIAIPLDQMSQITQRKSLFRMQQIRCHFKDSQLPPLTLVFKESQLSEFPVLTSRATQETRSERSFNISTWLRIALLIGAGIYLLIALQ